MLDDSYIERRFQVTIPFRNTNLKFRQNSQGQLYLSANSALDSTNLVQIRDYIEESKNPSNFNLTIDAISCISSNPELNRLTPFQVDINSEAVEFEPSNRSEISRFGFDIPDGANVSQEERSFQYAVSAKYDDVKRYCFQRPGTILPILDNHLVGGYIYSYREGNDYDRYNIETGALQTLSVPYLQIVKASNEVVVGRAQDPLFINDSEFYDLDGAAPISIFDLPGATPATAHRLIDWGVYGKTLWVAHYDTQVVNPPLLITKYCKQAPGVWVVDLDGVQVAVYRRIDGTIDPVRGDFIKTVSISEESIYAILDLGVKVVMQIVIVPTGLALGLEVNGGIDSEQNGFNLSKAVIYYGFAEELESSPLNIFARYETGTSEIYWYHLSEEAGKALSGRFRLVKIFNSEDIIDRVRRYINTAYFKSGNNLVLCNLTDGSFKIVDVAKTYGFDILSGFRVDQFSINNSGLLVGGLSRNNSNTTKFFHLQNTRERNKVYYYSADLINRVLQFRPSSTLAIRVAPVLGATQTLTIGQEGARIQTTKIEELEILQLKVNFRISFTKEMATVNPIRPPRAEVSRPGEKQNRFEARRDNLPGGSITDMVKRQLGYVPEDFDVSKFLGMY